MSDEAGTQLTRDDPAYVVALAQLWADQFQHMTTLAVSGPAGTSPRFCSSEMRVTVR